MEARQNDLPPAFRQTFAAGQAAIAQAQEQARQTGDGQPLLQTVRDQLRLLKAISPALVDDCLPYARMLESHLRALVVQRIDEGLLDQPAVGTLLDLGPVEVRQYHFVGELALTLDYFDQRFLGASEEAQLRETITRQGLAVEQALQGLLSHVINEVLFDRKERTALRQAADSLATVRVLLAKPREPGLLKADHTVRRRQFIRRAGWLCLRHYGHVTTDTMARLLEAKQAYYLAGDETVSDDPELPLEAAINRELSTLRDQARKRSVADGWDTAAVVSAFFGKSHWKAWRPDEGAGRTNAGIRSATLHIDLPG